MRRVTIDEHLTDQGNRIAELEDKMDRFGMVLEKIVNEINDLKAEIRRNYPDGLGQTAINSSKECTNGEN